jgi:nitrogen fixation protein FixH
MSEKAAKELTGKHVLFMVLAFFGVIIAVNFTMAYQAVSTFPGLEVKNGYVASQNFDKERAAQLALGWKASASIEDGVLRLQLLDREGQPVQPAELTGTLGRPTVVSEDQELEFSFDGRAYHAPVRSAPGKWNLRFVALSEDGTKFRQRLVLYVDD